MNNIIKSAAITKVLGGCFLDKNYILYKWINGEFIGKRSIQTMSLRAVWIEDLKGETIKSWWCGKGSNYTEIFKLNNNDTDS